MNAAVLFTSVSATPTTSEVIGNKRRVEKGKNENDGERVVLIRIV